MGVLPLPSVAQLSDGLLLAHRNEDRVVPETFRPPRGIGDSPLEHAGSAHLALGRDGDQLADIPGEAAVALDLFERLEQAPDRVVAPEARRLRARAPVQPGDLYAGVLAEHPHVLGRSRAPEARLRTRVGEVSRPVFGRILRCFEQVESPVRQGGPQLFELVLVAGGQERYPLQRASSTSGS